MPSLKRIGAYAVDILLLFAFLAAAATAVERLLRIAPQTPREVWLATVVSFSIPVWLYFALSDHSRSGATIGKRLFRLRVIRVGGSRVGLPRALARTAVKLLPWEMAHLFGFAIAEQVGPAMQAAGLIAANAIAVIYFAALLATRGSRSIHDLLVDTVVIDS